MCSLSKSCYVGLSNSSAYMKLPILIFKKKYYQYLENAEKSKIWVFCA
jgi:hypothetical protein